MNQDAPISWLRWPTQAFFGSGVLSRLPEVLRRLRARRVAVVCGKNFALRSGLLEGLRNLICEAKAGTVLWHGVRPDPNSDLVDAYGRKARIGP